MTTSKRRLSRRLYATAIASAAATHILALAGATGRLDEAILDALMRLRNSVDAWRHTGDANVVQIDIDDESIAALDGPFPGRSHLASVIRALTAAGVGAQVYDFVFAGGPDAADAELVEAVRSAGNVLVGAVAQNVVSVEPRTGRATVGQPWPLRVVGDPAAIPSHTSIIGPFPDLGAVVRGTGALNVRPDADGIFRRLPLVVRDRSGAYYPSLALAVACAYFDVEPRDVEVQVGRALILRGARAPGESARDVSIPIDDTGAMRLNFFGDWESIKHPRFARLWHDSLDPTAVPSWEAAVKGRIALVADVSTGRADIGAVPVDAVYPLSGLHATALRNIVAGRFLSMAWAPATWALEALAAVALLVVALAWPRWLWAAAALGLLTIAAIAAVLFIGRGVLLPVAAPVITAVLFAGAAGAWRFFEESRARELTRRAFESYFPPAVVARLIAKEAHVAGSRRRVVTVLFSDIVGFTARSANMAPEAVERFLNEYFSSMVAIVFQHGGTVDKFIGDGLMVFFNDPEEQPDHAERGVQCAIAMQARVLEVSEACIAAGEPALDIRIGIHTGSAVVGDLGSSERLSYTAVGATVNLAQRLEAAAPPGGILISGDTAALLTAEVPLSPMGEMRLKGFDAPVRVFLVASGSRSEVA